ncbi:DUF2484 family protein [Shimia abyssi]|uniref:Uncharacterized protein DUF2484 n=1 Tax=Shimia abyssi TaxID=1662395 RepID=A0A2P8FJM9_9RHOB|nr:DUF2484 family protein [Shimia abyssi]PSL21933.1 uncharacterized protein DUF2484 [Shimia abyssi]
MSWILILACFWVLAAVGVAMLPMRSQYVPGVGLLVMAPVLIGVIWWMHGPGLAVVALLGFLSMFRRPLVYFYRRARGFENNEVVE